MQKSSLAAFLSFYGYYVAGERVCNRCANKEITHEKNLVGCKQAADPFVGTMRVLGDRLGPLPLQLGDRREFSSGHTHPKKDRAEDLRRWSGVTDRFFREGKTIFAYANNHYQNHSPSTVEEFLQIRRGERG